MLRRVDRHATPAAADIEQPHTGGEAQLARHQVELLFLGLFQRRIDLRVHRAGVSHGRAEHLFVEGVRDVVVRRDRGRVTVTRMAQPVQRALPLRRCLFGRGPGRQQTLDAEFAQQAGNLADRRPAQVPGREPRSASYGSPGCTPDLEIAGDVGPGHAELAGSGEHVPQSPLVDEVQLDGRTGGPDRTSVIRTDPQRWLTLQ